MTTWIRRDLQIAPEAAVLALIAGAGAGGLIFVGLMLAASVEAGAGVDAMEIGGLFLAFLGVALFYLVGLVVTGVPVWILAHRLGLRDWWCAMLAGALLNGGLIAIALPASPTSRMPVFLFFGVIGAAVGWVIWRVAYRKVRAPVEEVF